MELAIEEIAAFEPDAFVILFSVDIFEGDMPNLVFMKMNNGNSVDALSASVIEILRGLA